MTLKTLSIKEKLDKLDFIKMKIFCTLKDTKERRTIKITYKKMFSNHVCEDIDWNAHMLLMGT